MTSLPSKVCTKCKTTKFLTEYHRDKHKRSGYVSRCKTCRNEDSFISREKNPESTQAGLRRYREANRDVLNIKAQQSRDSNPQKSRNTTLDYQKRNTLRSTEEIAEAQQRLRPSGMKKCRHCKLDKSLAEFYRKNRNADGLRSECILCAIAIATTKRTLKINQSFDARGLDSCVYCFGPYEHIEHVLCLALGGSDALNNLVPSCANCNFRKGKQSPWVWLNKIRPDVDPKILLDSWEICWTDWHDSPVP